MFSYSTSSASLKTQTAESGLSVIIPTCNRGAGILETVYSLLETELPQLEIIIIDQSDDGMTAVALSTLIEAGKVNYIHTPIKGSGRARNQGVLAAQNEFVALTDDDCIVSRNWPNVIIGIFRQHPDTAVIYTNVLPKPHNSEEGFTPGYILEEDRLIASPLQIVKSRGLGASMAIRQSAFINIGGFDEQMDPGSRFQSASDRDIAIRAILKGYTVFETSEAHVLRNGFCTWEQGKDLSQRDWFGLGAMCIKFLKQGYLSGIPMTVSYFFYGTIFRPLWISAATGKATGFRRSIYFMQGCWQGLKVKVNPVTLTYDIK